MRPTAPRLTPWGDCTACAHVRAPWHCGEPESYPVPVAIDQARAGAGWPYIDHQEHAPPPAAGRLDLSRQYHEGGACGPTARRFELRANLT